MKIIRTMSGLQKINEGGSSSDCEHRVAVSNAYIKNLSLYQRYFHLDNCILEDCELSYDGKTTVSIANNVTFKRVTQRFENEVSVSFSLDGEVNNKNKASFMDCSFNKLVLASSGLSCVLHACKIGTLGLYSFKPEESISRTFITNCDIEVLHSNNFSNVLSSITNTQVDEIILTKEKVTTEKNWNKVAHLISLANKGRHLGYCKFMKVKVFDVNFQNTSFMATVFEDCEVSNCDFSKTGNSGMIHPLSFIRCVLKDNKMGNIGYEESNI